MPLQSRGKGRRGVKQQQQRNAAESQAKVMYRKAALEVDMLNEHMVPWRGMAWQASTDHEGLKRRLRDLEKALEQAREDKRDMHEAMARQYQELQEQTASRRRSLEMEVKSLQEQLAASLRERQLTQEMAAQALAEKDVTITQLQSRLDTMEMEYEKILHVSGDVAVGGCPRQRSNPSSLSPLPPGQPGPCLGQAGRGQPVLGGDGYIHLPGEQGAPAGVWPQPPGDIAPWRPPGEDGLARTLPPHAFRFPIPIAHHPSSLGPGKRTEMIALIWPWDMLHAAEMQTSL
ncbi:dynein regulatory complex protein 12 isoform X3 [Struthio camelus]